MVIHGHRVADDALKEDPFRPGAYGRVLGLQTPDAWDWMAVTPNGLCANLSAHEVVEHDDGTITVSPSLLIEERRDGVDHELWHGYLERGDWRKC